MKKYFSISEAAKAVHTTSETLRHYDRIGLVKPSKKDEWTQYRYYTEQDIVRLNTVRALQQMDLPLKEIKRVLEYDDLEKIVDYLAQAEKKADAKIAALQYSKTKIQLAKANYESKLPDGQKNNGIFLKAFPARVIMLSETLERPSLDTLWNYHRHFYKAIDPCVKDRFTFADAAGIYTENGRSQMFAVCIRYTQTDAVKVLPAGNYLCIDCTEENREAAYRELLRSATEKYGVRPKFSIEMIVVSGILQWKYQIQMCIDKS